MGFFGRGGEEDWAAAPAEVLEAERSSFARTVGNEAIVGNTSVTWKLRLLVKPEGGAPFEARAKCHLVQTRSVRVGQTLSVRYRPSDPSSVEIDDRPEARLDAVIDGIVGGDARLAGASVGGMSLADVVRQGMADPEALRERMMREFAPGGMAMPGGMPANPWAASAPAEDDPIAQLERLADLRDRGVLTEEEFAEQKRRVLGG